MTPRVSIVIPAYNNEQYLAETLDSVLNQTYDDYEVVIADHSSVGDISIGATLQLIEMTPVHHPPDPLPDDAVKGWMPWGGTVIGSCAPLGVSVPPGSCFFPSVLLVGPAETICIAIGVPSVAKVLLTTLMVMLSQALDILILQCF